MTEIASKIRANFDRVLNTAVTIASALLAFAMLTVGIDVILRMFGWPIRWQIEINQILLFFMVMLPAAKLMREGKHVRMDLLPLRLKPNYQLLLGIFNAFLGVVICGIIFWYGVQTTWNHWRGGIYQPSFLNIPNATVLWIIPVAYLLLLIQCLRKIHQSITTLKSVPLSQR
ncbi:MAG: TRAP transporter small permease [Chloroflexi bacterium]|nr:TRAP transporter small permease [Chloroflexota bacterium]